MLSGRIDLPDAHTLLRDRGRDVLLAETGRGKGCKGCFRVPGSAGGVELQLSLSWGQPPPAANSSDMYVLEACLLCTKQ